MALSSLQKHKLKKFVRTLERIKGRHTELVSVYIPAGYDLNKILTHLAQEQGTASNIKDKNTRQHVIDSLEKMIRHLRLFKQTPENGLAVFAGNSAEREDKVDINVWSMEPPMPINVRTYRCDQSFQLDILKEFLEHKESYGLIILDRKEATIGILKGTQIKTLVDMHSNVPGKFKAGGQCLVKDSLVQLANGPIVEIKNMHNPHIVKSAIMEDNYDLIDSNVTDKWNSRKDEVYKITTKYPRLEVESSKDHVFFVSTEKGIIEKSAEELKEGDYLIMPEQIKIKGKTQNIKSKKYYNSFIINKEGQKILRKKREEKGFLQKDLAKKINLTQTTISSYEIGKLNADRDKLKKVCSALGINFENFITKFTKPSLYKNVKLPQKLNEDFAQFIGYLIGDGCLETDRASFFEQNKELALAYKKKFEKLFNMNTSYKFRESKNYHQLRFISRPLVRLLKEEFPELKYAHNSKIPEKILRSKNKIVAGFLRGLFDAEGFASANQKLGIGMNNKALILQLQMMLLRFGIISSFLEYDNRKNSYSNNPRFTLEISEKDSMQSFKKHIGFSSIEKANLLNQILKQKSERSNVRQILISGKKVKEIIEKYDYKLKDFPRVSNFFQDKKMMSKVAFKNSILKYIKNRTLHNELKKIYDYCILPVKINKITKSKKDVEMADISVKNKNFIVNCIIAHNSAQRFSRIREEATKEFLNRINDAAQKEFLGLKNLKGILLGGPGNLKNELMNSNYFNNELKEKVVSIQDLSYIGDFGLKELVERSQEVLSKEAIAEERSIMEKFMKLLSTNEKKVAYGEKEVKNALNLNAVETLLLSEEVDEKLSEELEDQAESAGSEVKFISTETAEGVQLKELGGVAAILRYELH